MMKYKQWKLSPQEEESFLALRGEAVPPLVAAVLCARGLGTREQATEFLSWHPRLLCDPFQMQDMELAVARISLAIERGEKLAVYGDYDVDGITATCLLTHYLKSCGASVAYYIPCRLEEGYGVNCEAIDTLHAEGVQLIITVDCGITAVTEAAYAKKLGIDMIITDHHSCKEALPEVVAVLDPHRRDCSYPFKDLAGVGVALKLVMAHAGEAQSREILERYCDLAAVGTVADVMRLLGENRTLVCMGLERLQNSARVGLRALIEEAGAGAQSVSSTTVGFCLAPRINAAGRMGQACTAAELILTEDPQEALRLSQQLCELNRERQAVELAIFTDCTEQLDAQTRHDSIVMAGEGWHQGVVGIVASRLTERYACPVFMISLQDGRGKGSCRSYGGFNLFLALEACSDLLEGYGGHALAAGFTIAEAHIPTFRARMEALVREETGGEELISTLVIDACVSKLQTLNVEEVGRLTMLEPYGNGNPKPVFSLEAVTVSCLSDVGGGRHLKLRIGREGRSLDAIFFSTTRQSTGLQVGDVIDLAFYPQVNEFRGLRSVQLHVVDLRPAAKTEGGTDGAVTEAQLYARFCQGQSLSAQAADALLPAREDFAALWRYLKSRGGVADETAESLAQNTERLSRRQTSETRARICLDVFEECGLIQLEQRGASLRVHSRAKLGEKLDLEKTPLMRRLRKMAAEA